MAEIQRCKTACFTSRWACEPCCPTQPTSRHNSEHCRSPGGTSEQTTYGQPARRRESTELLQKQNAGLRKSFPVPQRGGRWHWGTLLCPTSDRKSRRLNSSHVAI